MSNQENGYSRISISLIKERAAGYSEGWQALHYTGSVYLSMCGCVCVCKREKARGSPRGSAGTLHQQSEREINHLLSSLHSLKQIHNLVSTQAARDESESRGVSISVSSVICICDSAA